MHSIPYKINQVLNSVQAITLINFLPIIFQPFIPTVIGELNWKFKAIFLYTFSNIFWHVYLIWHSKHLLFVTFFGVFNFFLFFLLFLLRELKQGLVTFSSNITSLASSSYVLCALAYFSFFDEISFFSRLGWLITTASHSESFARKLTKRLSTCTDVLLRGGCKVIQCLSFYVLVKVGDVFAIVVVEPKLRFRGQLQ